MQVYELCYLILPSVAEDALSSVADKIKEAISKVEGKDFDSETPFKHPLSYQMSKTVGASKYVVNDAYIGWIKFEIEPAKIADVEAAMKKISEVLRFLIVKAPRKTEFTFAKAKALIRAKEEKEKEPASVDDSGVVTEVVVE
ncbi:MAG: hypothetical protein A2832_00595 [Candidatus Zambryskibacteria bacterium RIFCSPHIGHO2_01_FULL_44_22b]|uniref:Small ribosomal subunit protein bS6 n=2 Tax=Candidatus Zambryskiibacteriota TaxID=1817925 RepID=A0A1G2T2I6_9BACT|nr:MAG: hypothetical protein A2832_00595 [Candidatus Zambryskibacteria bacterium RIFCSPHIGHO2_01_FULL_44_22b]OHB06385.1 MAG: hypothetical protein A3B16_00270 [Candidatus Zambryskibacteria bacterium RIFCSPLOWO2_01_FULL_45_43]